MGANYAEVADALQQGAQPEMLCATCPWDRYCVQPPSMTSAQVQAQIDKAKNEDEKRRAEAVAAGVPPDQLPMPVGSLMVSLAVGQADKTSIICPVFSVRLRSSAGRGIADALKAHMQTVDDNEVGAQ